MKKFVVTLVFISLFCVFGFSQSTRKTRPRIVKIPAPSSSPSADTTTKNDSKTTKPPVLKNETKSPPKLGKPPVLIDNTSKKAPTKTPENTTEPVDDSVIEDDDEIIEVETNLVTLPVTVLDRQGRFISGISQREFKIFENGIQQRIEYFASVEKPFTVVLLLDVSPSTRYKIDEIQRAAISFVDQLRPNDKVMVVAFDERYKVLTPPTSDRYQLRNAIRRANFGGGTSLYDAVSKTINQQLRSLTGRKAIVLFTDGVDTTSRMANYQSTLLQVEEVDALIYPIRYDTYQGYTGGGGNTPRRRQPRTGNILIDILGGILNGGNVRIGGGGAGTSQEEYEKGKTYLGELARYSGGRMFEADTIYNLDSAFRSIAEELRRQYSLGYYPENVGEKGERKKIRVRVMRPNLVVRTKNSYIVGQ